METYELDQTPSPDSGEICGTQDYALRRADRRETVICYMRLPVGDESFWNKLLRAQAEKAWEAGFDFARAGSYYEGCNPYTVQSND